MSRVYVSGQITGLDPTFARARFAAAARYLQDRGDDALNPYDVSPCPDGSCVESPGNPRSNGHTWGCWLRFDLIGMLGCDGVLALPGWTVSNGAVLEVTTALRVGMQVEFMPPATLEAFLPREWQFRVGPFISGDMPIVPTELLRGNRDE